KLVIALPEYILSVRLDRYSPRRIRNHGCKVNPLFCRWCGVPPGSAKSGLVRMLNSIKIAGGWMYCC
ncbi:hypothetical protein NPIL_495141, partial [Nephila pilipes]